MDKDMRLDEKTEAAISAISSWDEWSGNNILTDRFHHILEAIIADGQPKPQITPADSALISNWLVYGVWATVAVTVDGWFLSVDDAAGRELFFVEGDREPDAHDIKQFQAHLQTMGDRLRESGGPEWAA